MTMMRLLTMAVLASALGCATSFTGSAHVESGRAGCEAKCRGVGMQVAGMVYMGEYSSACVCEVPRATASSKRDSLLAGAGATAAGVAGVAMQMQREAAQRQNR